uniref:Uncharacterized protein n=1 Tax=Avena sativa TaxID=4498 RepID=A0ACD6A609_AVESA
MERRGGAAAAASLDLPGFRFHPTEEELLEFYLKQQVTKKKQQVKAPFDIIPTVHLYRHDPWDLPALAAIASEREWYFFVPRDGGGRGKLQGAGGRPSRTTERGFWKATGSDRAVRCAADPKRLVGLKKTLVYYQGRAPRGSKTDWVMNEYRLPDAVVDGGAGKGEQQEVVLCKVYRKAVSLKELEQRVAMEELARARSSSATPSQSHCSAGSPDVSSSSASEVFHEAPAGSVGVKKEEVSVAAVARPAAMRLPQLETARGQQAGGGLEWMQDPFLTQLRSPWMEGLCLSPFYASVLNF